MNGCNTNLCSCKSGFQPFYIGHQQTPKLLISPCEIDRIDSPSLRGKVSPVDISKPRSLRWHQACEACINQWIALKGRSCAVCQESPPSFYRKEEEHDSMKMIRFNYAADLKQELILAIQENNSEDHLIPIIKRFIRAGGAISSEIMSEATACKCSLQVLTLLVQFGGIVTWEMLKDFRLSESMDLLPVFIKDCIKLSIVDAYNILISEHPYEVIKVIILVFLNKNNVPLTQREKDNIDQFVHYLILDVKNEKGLISLNLLSFMSKKSVTLTSFLIDLLKVAKKTDVLGVVEEFLKKVSLDEALEIFSSKINEEIPNSEDLLFYLGQNGMTPEVVEFSTKFLMYSNDMTYLGLMEYAMKRGPLKSVQVLFDQWRKIGGILSLQIIEKLVPHQRKDLKNFFIEELVQVPQFKSSVEVIKDALSCRCSLSTIKLLVSRAEQLGILLPESIAIACLEHQNSLEILKYIRSRGASISPDCVIAAIQLGQSTEVCEYVLSECKKQKKNIPLEEVMDLLRKEKVSLQIFKVLIQDVFSLEKGSLQIMKPALLEIVLSWNKPLKEIKLFIDACLELPVQHLKPIPIACTATHNSWEALQYIEKRGVAVDFSSSFYFKECLDDLILLCKRGGLHDIANFSSKLLENGIFNLEFFKVLIREPSISAGNLEVIIRTVFSSNYKSFDATIPFIDALKELNPSLLNLAAVACLKPWEFNSMAALKYIRNQGGAITSDCLIEAVRFRKSKEVLEYVISEFKKDGGEFPAQKIASLLQGIDCSGDIFKLLMSPLLPSENPPHHSPLDDQTLFDLVECVLHRSSRRYSDRPKKDEPEILSAIQILEFLVQSLAKTRGEIIVQILIDLLGGGYTSPVAAQLLVLFIRSGGKSSSELFMKSIREGDISKSTEDVRLSMIHSFVENGGKVDSDLLKKVFERHWGEAEKRVLIKAFIESEEEIPLEFLVTVICPTRPFEIVKPLIEKFIHRNGAINLRILNVISSCNSGDSLTGELIDLIDKLDVSIETFMEFDNLRSFLWNGSRSLSIVNHLLEKGAVVKTELIINILEETFSESIKNLFLQKWFETQKEVPFDVLKASLRRYNSFELVDDLLSKTHSLTEEESMELLRTAIYYRCSASVVSLFFEDGKRISLEFLKEMLHLQLPGELQELLVSEFEKNGGVLSEGIFRGIFYLSPNLKKYA